MLSDSTSPADAASLAADLADRRSHARFPMQLEVLLRSASAGENWIVCRTRDVSASGACLESPISLACNVNLEYIITLPSDLTRTALPLRVRFYGSVVRVDRLRDDVFSIAVCNTNYRYLSPEESEAISALAELRPSSTE